MANITDEVCSVALFILHHQSPMAVQTVSRGEIFHSFFGILLMSIPTNVD